MLLTRASLVYLLPVKDSKDKWGLGKLVVPLEWSRSAALQLSSKGLFCGPCPFCLFQLPVEFESSVPSVERALRVEITGCDKWCPVGMSHLGPRPLQDQTPGGWGEGFLDPASASPHPLCFSPHQPSVPLCPLVPVKIKAI